MAYSSSRTANISATLLPKVIADPIASVTNISFPLSSWTVPPGTDEYIQSLDIRLYITMTTGALAKLSFLKMSLVHLVSGVTV